MTVRNRIQSGDGDPRHGTTNGYSNHGCRCEDCTVAWATYHRQYMGTNLHQREKRNLRSRLWYAAKRREGAA